MYHSVRRICHASPASGGIASCSWVAAGAAVITPQHRYITYAAGFPPSPWEAVRKSHYSPYRSMRTGCCPGLQGLYVDRSASLSHFPPFTSWRPGGAPYPAAAWFSYPQYRVFSFQSTTNGTKHVPFTMRIKRGFFSKQKKVEQNCSQNIYNRFLCAAQAGVYGLGCNSLHICNPLNIKVANISQAQTAILLF